MKSGSRNSKMFGIGRISQSSKATKSDRCLTVLHAIIGSVSKTTSYQITPKISSLRFRRYAVAIACDIALMYQQIRILGGR